ncbi:hypothetical protein BLOT_014571 [Blomia tropicalis]|nr:hypothetical protein BLOT_014571 [Blomia tropicalis]
MSSLTEKMPTDFNAIFKNDELAKEISQLIEKANSKNASKILCYSKDELLAIRCSPLSEIPKAVIRDRLSKANLSDNIIHSLLKKSRLEKSEQIFDSQENITVIMDEAVSNYRFKQNSRNGKNRENVETFRENVNNSSRYEREKSYRPTNSDVAPCWRTDKSFNNNSHHYNGGINNRSSHNRNEYNSDRFSHSRKFDRYSKNSYGHNGYREEYEEEPEWFSNGPESMNDFIDLKGFDDDEIEEPESNNKTDNGHSNKFNTENDREPDSSLNESRNKIDISDLFNSSNPSLLDNKDTTDFSIPMFGDVNLSNMSSRAQKWFKNNRNQSANVNHMANAMKNASSIESDRANSLMDLFEKYSNSSKVEDIKVDMSKATSLAELEASMLNTPAPKKAAHETSRDSSVFAKLLSMAGDSNENGKPIPNKLENEMNHEKGNDMLNHPFGGGGENQFRKPIHDPRQFPMIPPELQHMAAMNPMMNPYIYKGPNPMGPFPVPENGLPPFAHMVDGMNPRLATPYMPPPMLHQFPPMFLPGYMPNPSHMMMNNPHPIPPHIVNEIMARCNSMGHHPPQATMNANEMSKSPSPKVDDSNIADKLLKNMKFTPTSVFRRLKDPIKTKPEANIINNDNNNLPDSMFQAKSVDPFEMIKEQRAPTMAETSFIPHPLSNVNQQSNNKDSNSEMEKMFQQINLNYSHSRSQSKEQSLLQGIQQQASMGRQEHPSTSGDQKPVTFNANDIFSAMKNNDRTAPKIDLPPLPIKNALMLEDLEKF